MRILISYPTPVGTFYIGQTLDRRYHVIFDEESLGNFKAVQDAVDSLVDNKLENVKDPDSGENIDTSTLKIPRDYTQWDSSY